MNFPVIDVKSLWDMDSQEGSKMPFAVGSKFDHLSPEHGNNMQKKVYLLSSINCMTYYVYINVIFDYFNSLP